MYKSFVYFLLAILMSLAIVQCNSDGKAEVSSQNIQSKSDSTIHYEAEIIGWSSEYPADWKVISKNEQLRLEDTGKQAMEKTTGLPTHQRRANKLAVVA